MKLRKKNSGFSLPTTHPLDGGVGGDFFCHSVDTKTNLNYKNVLDFYFKMNPGFCFYPDRVSPRDHEMITMQKIIC